MNETRYDVEVMTVLL